jgi:hypothetical protein
VFGGNGEVDEVEVHIVEPQLLQAVLQGLCYVPVVGVPKLHQFRWVINRGGTHCSEFGEATGEVRRMLQETKAKSHDGP